MITVKSNLIEKYLEVCPQTILIFGSPNCSHCTKLLKNISSLEEEKAEYTFMFIDGDKFEDLSEKYKIEYFPTVIKIHDGKEISRIVSGEVKKIRKKLKL